MSSETEPIQCGDFIFYNNFDSANLARVEPVVLPENPTVLDNEAKCCKGSGEESTSEYEFNVWTKHDCHGTEYQNNNRTWFYFGVGTNAPGALVKFNVINLNKQMKMFSQGMCPVYKVVPGHPQWERVRDKPTYCADEKGIEFNLSFTHRISENPKAVTYFAFTYPFTYTDLQNHLKKMDAKMGNRNLASPDEIYYHRECAIHSLEGRRLDLLTISSFHNITTEKEDSLPNMFPEEEERPFKFKDKRIIFLSARVHPGETPSSFVLNGFFNFLLNREDSIAINLRRLYVFKLIPMLNPDGVARGHYRMDTKGVNLNRVYLNPSRKDHPTIYAARNLIRYYHHRYELRPETESVNLKGDGNCTENATRDTNKLLQQVTLMSLDETEKIDLENECLKKPRVDEEENAKNATDEERGNTSSPDPEDSGIFLYVDMHGHASKKGIFMYGNHFDDPEDSITCMLLPKLMSINNANFHFTSCNFAERNMYLIDKRDGMSREGSGRVAVYKTTGLVRSYTLECNYNSGRLVNSMPPRVRDGGTVKQPSQVFVPPKYTPSIYEEVGASLGPSILDLTGNNPNSRIPSSQYRCLRGVKNYLKLTYVNNLTESLNKRLRKDGKTVDSELVEAKVASSSGSSEVPKVEGNSPKKPCIARRSTSLYTAMKKMRSSKKRKSGAETSPAMAKVLSTQIKVKKLLKATEKEETTVVKQGSKRLKVAASKSLPKAGGDEKVGASRMLMLYNKQKTKENFGKSRAKNLKPKKSSKLKSGSHPVDE